MMCAYLVLHKHEPRQSINPLAYAVAAVPLARCELEGLAHSIAPHTVWDLLQEDLCPCQHRA